MSLRSVIFKTSQENKTRNLQNRKFLKLVVPRTSLSPDQFPPRAVTSQWSVYLPDQLRTLTASGIRDKIVLTANSISRSLRVTKDNLSVTKTSRN